MSHQVEGKIIMSDIVLFHGSSVIVDKPDLSHGRTKIDFGRGFYTTQDREMACRWASGKDNAIISVFEFKDYGDLNIKHFQLDELWLHYVAINRGLMYGKIRDKTIDIAIGPTADDKLFATMNNYFSNAISEEQAIRYLNAANYSEQVVFKTMKALDCLEFTETFTLSEDEKQKYIEETTRIRNETTARLSQMQRQDNAVDFSNLTIDFDSDEELDRIGDERDE